MEIKQRAQEMIQALLDAENRRESSEIGTILQFNHRRVGPTWVNKEVASKLPSWCQIEAAPFQVSEHPVPGITAWAISLPSWPVSLQEGPVLGVVGQSCPRCAQLDRHSGLREGEVLVQGLQAVLPGIFWWLSVWTRVSSLKKLILSD